MKITKPTNKLHYLILPMENIDSLLRMIRIDWEETQSVDFNPLPLALQFTNENSDEFKNTYHKIERVMMNIIESSFKGFSDSILSYKACTHNVNENLENLATMNLIIEEIKKSTHIKTNLLTKQKELIKNQEALIDKLEMLIDLRNSIRDKSSENVEEGAYNILKCLSLYKKCSDLKPVRLVQYDIERKKAELIDKISKGIILFICETKGGVLFNVRSIFILQLYAVLDKSLILPAKTCLISSLQNKINEYNNCEHDGERGLAKHLNSFFGSVLSQYDDMMKRIKTYKKKTNNFFEKDYVPTGFFKKSVFVGLVKKEIFRLINNFKVHTKEHTYDKFILDEIEESETINKLLDKKVSLLITTQNIEDQEFKHGGYEIVMDNGLDFIFYLYEDIFEEAKHDLYKFLKNNYFTEKEKKIDEKLISIFESKFNKIEGKKSALLPHIQHIIEHNDFFGLDFGLSNLVTIFKGIIKGFNDNYNSLYQCKVYENIFKDPIKKEQEKEIDVHLNIFKAYIKNNKIQACDCFSVLKNREICFYLFETIQEIRSLFMKTRIKYEKISINPALAEIEYDLRDIYLKYKISFKFQFIIDILFLFDHFYCEGKFGGKSPFFKEIIHSIQRLYNITQPKDVDLSGFFDSIEYFIFNNLSKHNVTNSEELVLFVEDLKTIEEVIFNFEMQYEVGFENILAFYKSILENNIDTNEKREFANKINIK